MKNNGKRTDVYAEITNRIIEAIEAGAGDPVMPWHRSGMASGLPKNVMTGNAYQGVNIINLWISAELLGYHSNQWGTYKQFKKIGAQVRKGERGTIIIFYKEITVEDEAEEDQIRRIGRG